VKNARQTLKTHIQTRYENITTQLHNTTLQGKIRVRLRLRSRGRVKVRARVSVRVRVRVRVSVRVEAMHRVMLG
jgi:hypothetical protein